MSVNEHETHAAVVADIHKIAKRFHEDYLSDPVEFKGYERIANEFSTLASRFEAAHKREVDALKQRLAELNAEIAAKDAVIMWLNDALAEEQGRKMTTAEKNAAKLPDGWKMYDKYQIRHTDGTPLKGKRYFVLRLDSDDPLEAARVAAAMSAYKGEAQSGNVAAMRKALARATRTLSAWRRDLPCRAWSEIDEAIDKCNTALAAPPRNCDIPAKDMGEWCDRFYDYVRRNNPACIRPSPLYTYHDAIKWMLDEANTNKEA